jgi:hypothetical protein
MRFAPTRSCNWFVFDDVRMQSEDVGAMLRLPMRAHGLTNGCNFASASVICNLLSGVSVIIFQPAVTQRPDRHGRMQTIGSGEAFWEFVKAFYPDPSPQRRSEVADVCFIGTSGTHSHMRSVYSEKAAFSSR